MHNNKLGYYRVGDSEFVHKIPALLEASHSGIFPQWVFNQNVFDRVDWTQEPSQSLWDLYGQRARDLREKYDYLILAYSGGSDSKNMLDVFLANGIRIDEIVSKYSAKGMGSTYRPSRASAINYDDNMYAEWEFTAKPDLQWLAQHHPEIKLTLDDWFDYTDLSIGEEWFMTKNFIMTPFGEARRSIERLISVDKKQRVGYIMGIDKPRIAYKDGRYYIYFIDAPCYGMMPDRTVVGNATVEFFYWAPESEAMLRKQAHICKRYFQSRPHLSGLIQWPPKPNLKRDIYENLIRSLVYSTWDPARFQCAKSMDPVVAFDQALLDNFSSVHDRHHHGLAYLDQVLDPRFKGRDFGTYIVMLGGFYPL